jgi:predicted Zn-dependent protease
MQDLASPPPRAFSLLMKLRRYDEAEEMMHRGSQNHPKDPFFMQDLAEIALAKDNHDEAIERCARLRKRFPGVVRGYVVGASSLAARNRLDEADALAKQAMKQFPEDIGGFLEYARVAGRRHDWEEALRRWEVVYKQFGYFGGYIGAADVLAELGRHDEADELLATARMRAPLQSAPMVELARFAQAKGDIPEAVKRWKKLVEWHPGFMQGYFAAAEALEAMGQSAETEAVLHAAVARFPLDEYPLKELARLFHFKRRDFPAAAEAWATMRETFPQNEEAYIRGAEALQQAGCSQEAEALREEHRQRFKAT